MKNYDRFVDYACLINDWPTGLFDLVSVQRCIPHVFLCRFDQNNFSIINKDLELVCPENNTFYDFFSLDYFSLLLMQPSSFRVDAREWKIISRGSVENWNNIMLVVGYTLNGWYYLASCKHGRTVLLMRISYVQTWVRIK